MIIEAKSYRLNLAASLSTSEDRADLWTLGMIYQ